MFKYSDVIRMDPAPGIDHVISAGILHRGVRTAHGSSYIDGKVHSAQTESHGYTDSSNCKTRNGE